MSYLLYMDNLPYLLCFNCPDFDPTLDEGPRHLPGTHDPDLHGSGHAC